jgi:hypothetical protein
VRTNARAAGDGAEPEDATRVAAPATEAARTGRHGSELRDGLLYCLKVFLGVRIGTAILAVVGVALLPHLPTATNTIFGQTAPGPVGVPGWPAHAIAPGWHNLVTAWERFDALWFLRIAAHGYSTHDGSAAFFPLYPLLTRGLSVAIGGHPLAASLIVSNAAFLGALLVLYVLTRTELSDDMARRAVLYAAVFPTAFFFLAPYSESLFLLLVLVCLWAARRDRWAVAGIAGALAALTRNLGALLVLPLAVEAVQQALASRPRRPFPRHAWALAPAGGTLAYLWFWHHVTGDWLAPLHLQAGWQRHLTNPLATLSHGTQFARSFVGTYPVGYHTLDWLIAVPVLVAAVYAAFRFRPAYGVYTWASIIVPLSYVFADRPLMSFPRFALPIFPVFWALARWTDGHQVRHELVVGASAALLGLLLLLFVNWYYIF